MKKTLKVILNYLRFIWEKMGEPIEYPEDHDPFDERPDYYRASKPKDDSSWCPFCGYSGSAEELRVHLLNYHRK